MSRRRKLTLAAGVALVLIAAVLLWPRAKGPTYEGKTVEEWFHSYSEAFIFGSGVPDKFLQKKHAQTAFGTFGTNAVPYLVERMTQETTFSKLELWRIKLHDAIPSALKPLVPPPRDKEMEAGLAAILLSQHVHPPAEVLLPFLKPALEGINATQQRMALGSLAIASGDRKLALPYIVKALESPDQDVQSYAAYVLSTFKWKELDGLDLTAAVSNLTIVANSIFQQPAERALQALGQFGTNASSAIPALQGLLAKETDADRRMLITNALEKIQSPAAPERKPD